MFSISFYFARKKSEILDPRIQLFPTLQAKKDHHSEENNSLSFSKGDRIKIYNESLGWGVGRAGDRIGYFPLKYVAA